MRHEHPSWGARKIRDRLLRRFPRVFPSPPKVPFMRCLIATAWWSARGRARRRAQGTALSLGQRPNELWCADYKGEFLLGNRQYCYPLTVTDHASRFLLTCEALSSTRENYAFTVFDRLFRERGLPAKHSQRQWRAFRFRARLVPAIQARSLVAAPGDRHRTHQTGSSAAEWPSRTHASHAKERSHPTCGSQLPAAASPLRQIYRGLQQRRPHEALDMKFPVEVYTASAPLHRIAGHDYPFHDKTVVVTRCGRICYGQEKNQFQQVFAGQAVGIKEVHDDIWLVSFMDYDLGYFDLETRVLNHSKIHSGQKCYLCLRNNLLPMCPGRTFGIMVGAQGLEPRTSCV